MQDKAVRGTFSLDKKPEYKSNIKNKEFAEAISCKSVEEIDDYVSKTRGTWIWDAKLQKNVRLKRKPRKQVNAPYVITDEIDAIESMATEKREIFTSKRKLRQHYKQHGFIDTGGEQPKPPKPKTEDERFREIRDQVEKDYYDLKYDRVPQTEKERELCKQERENLEKYRKSQGML